MTLPASHPLRRFMSIFTFGSIWINNVAMHLLVGHRSPLDRGTAFKDYDGVDKMLPSLMKPLVQWHEKLLDDAEFEKLPQLIKDTPYYSDGRLLSREIKKMLMSMAKVMKMDDCKQTKLIPDGSIIRFLERIAVDEQLTGYDRSVRDDDDCGVLLKVFESVIWTVTGWHRHVGKVADLMSDPNLAGFSWKEGETSTRPRQAMLMSVVAAFTGSPHPKIIEDFTHLFVGVKGGEKMTQIWHDFQRGLQDVEAEVTKRNGQRHIKNAQGNPRNVECSVAV